MSSHLDPSLNTGGAGSLQHLYGQQEKDQSDLSVFPQTPPPSNQSVKNEQSKQTGAPDNAQEARKSRVTSFLIGGAKVLNVPIIAVGFALALPAAAVGAVYGGMVAATRAATSSTIVDKHARDMINRFTDDFVAKDQKASNSSIIKGGALVGVHTALFSSKILTYYSEREKFPDETFPKLGARL